jgi:adenosylmethionine-8-amino-7-oxononanoate aminotransferase
MPLGALLVRGEIAASWFTGKAGAPVLRHGQTYSGHPVCCAAAVATIDLLERDGLIERGRTLEGELERVLRPLEDHPAIAEVRAGLGLLAGIDLADDVLATVPRAVPTLQRDCRDAGVLVRPLLRGIAVSPPLTITPEEIAELGRRVTAGLERFAARAAQEATA